MPFRSFSGVYVVDDSGEFFSPLEGYNGQVRIRLPTSRWAALGAVRFSQSSIHEFVHDWTRLQAEIQHELRLPYLPAIHMRLMWGKDPARRPLCYKGKKKCKTRNPYRDSSAERTFEWTIKALKILNKYRKSSALLIRALAIDVHEFANSFEDSTIDEMNFLLKAVGKKTAMPLLRVLHNPYLVLLSDVLADIQVYENHKKIAVVVDNTSDIIGFEIDEKLIEEQTKKGANLTFIGRVEALGFDANQFPLLQASDVVAFFYRRMFEGDSLSRNLANSYLGLRPPKVTRRLSLPWNRKSIKKYNTQIIAQLVLRYQHAYRIAGKQNRAKKLLSLIIPPDKFAERVKEAFSEKKPLATLQVSILKEPLNGRDPVAYSYHGKR